MSPEGNGPPRLEAAALSGLKQNLEKDYRLFTIFSETSVIL